MKTDWNPVLRGEFAKPYWTELQRFVADERASHQVFPPVDDVFAALHQTPYESVKVVILGQDPYHGPGQAHGLAFSVRPGVAIPPSLVLLFLGDAMLTAHTIAARAADAQARIVKWDST